MVGRVLMTMFNVAPWGGLHENVWYSCRGLQKSGYDVTVAARPGPLVEKLEADGVSVRLIEWDRWQDHVDELAAESFDVVHAHPIWSRRLGVEVARASGATLLTTMHGYNTDEAFRWHGDARALMAVSRAHAQLLVDKDHVPPWKVFVVPNAVRDEVFSLEPMSWDEKTDGRVAEVVVASRLDADKRSLFEAVDQLTSALVTFGSDREWVVKILGAGTLTEEVGDFLHRQEAKSPRLRFEAAGWVESEQVPELLRAAVFSVASGRGAAQSLAVGTPTLAFGSRGVYGFQVDRNLQYGLWGNFGGYPLVGEEIIPIPLHVQRMLSGGAFYSDVQRHGREVAFSQLLQSSADRTLAGIYRL